MGLLLMCLGDSDSIPGVQPSNCNAMGAGAQLVNRLITIMAG